MIKPRKQNPQNPQIRINLWKSHLPVLRVPILILSETRSELESLNANTSLFQNFHQSPITSAVNFTYIQEKHSNWTYRKLTIKPPRGLLLRSGNGGVGLLVGGGGVYWLGGFIITDNFRRKCRPKKALFRV